MSVQFSKIIPINKYGKKTQIRQNKKTDATNYQQHKKTTQNTLSYIENILSKMFVFFHGKHQRSPAGSWKGRGYSTLTSLFLALEPDAAKRSQFELEPGLKVWHLWWKTTQVEITQICLQFPANTWIFLDFGFLDASTHGIEPAHGLWWDSVCERARTVIMLMILKVACWICYV